MLDSTLSVQTDTLLFFDTEIEIVESIRPPRLSRRLRRASPLRFLIRLPAAISERIPMEIVEAMLCCVGDLPRCKSTLAACSLVCKMWHVTSRRLLFRDVTVIIGTPERPVYSYRDDVVINWSQFSSIVLNPPPNFHSSFSAQRYIQKVCWRKGSSIDSFLEDDVTALFHAAAEFESLRSLVTHRARIPADSDFSQLTTILNDAQLQLTAQNILDLYLDQRCFDQIEGFFILVAALPRLERLAMRHFWEMSFRGRLDVRPAPSPPPSLRDLALWDCDSLIPVFRWITAAPNRITSLFVHDCKNLSEYLPLIGGSLRWICVELKGLSLFLSWTIY